MSAYKIFISSPGDVGRLLMTASWPVKTRIAKSERLTFCKKTSIALDDAPKQHKTLSSVTTEDGHESPWRTAWLLPPADTQSLLKGRYGWQDRARNRSHSGSDAP